MDPHLWHKVAAVSGVAALGLGTYGAHVFKPENPSYKEVWQTASLYHLVHTAALVAAPVTKHPNIFGGLLTAGIIAFSGTNALDLMLEGRLILFLTAMGYCLAYVPVEKAWSQLCYTVALLEDRKYSRLAPFGGFAFIGAWATLLF